MPTQITNNPFQSDNALLQTPVCAFPTQFNMPQRAYAHVFALILPMLASLIAAISILAR